MTASNTALATASNTSNALTAYNHLSREQIDLIKRTICKGATDDELALFVATANRMRLDPFAKQIHAVKRWDTKQNTHVMAIQVGIDGFRVAAHRTHEVDGQDGPYWCGEDKVWTDVWLDREPPKAAKVVVYRKGAAKPFTGIATYRSYVQLNQDKQPNAMWARGADFMLAKCAEAVALRKAFPDEIGGVVIPEEEGAEQDDAPAFQSLPAAPATNGNAPTAPAKPPKDKPATPTLFTEEQMEDFTTRIGKASTRAELKAVGKDIAATPMAKEQRDNLRAKAEAQLDDIEAAERADQENADNTQPDGDARD